MSREKAEEQIRDLYGLPPNAALEADDCLFAMLGELGFDALTDAAVLRLADLQLDHHEDATNDAIHAIT